MSRVEERLPPQNLEAEQSVLGALLIEPQAAARVAGMLRPEDFYRESHRVIYEAVLELVQSSTPVDMVTVADVLQRKGQLEAVGGTPYLAQLTMTVPTAANVEYYARIVEEKATLRALIGAATEIARRGYEGNEDAATLLDEAEQVILSVGERRRPEGFEPLSNVLVRTMARLEEYLHSPHGVTGVPSGFRSLDEKTAGFQPGDLIVIAARPAMGKTMLCLNFARNAALLHQVPVAIFSLEMPAEQLAFRLLCAESGVNGQVVRTGRSGDEEWQRLAVAASRLATAPIFIDDSHSITVLDVRARARRLKERHGLRMVVVDYLQLLQAHTRHENRQQEITAISRSLKALARELEIPVLALSQLSRAVELRQDKRPQLSDLRESGAIEQDADVVAFIYREKYYSKDDTDDQDIAELIIAKQRNGPTGVVRLAFRREIGRFYEVDPVHEPF